MEISDAELERIKVVAVLDSKMEEMETFIPEIFASLKAMNKSIVELPLQVTTQIIECRERIEKDMHGKFITDVDIVKLERKLEDKVEFEVTEINKELVKVSYKVSKAQWVTIGFMSAISVLAFFITKTNFFN